MVNFDKNRNERIKDTQRNDLENKDDLDKLNEQLDLFSIFC